MKWGVSLLHHLKARPAFLLRLDYFPMPSVALPFFLWQIFLPRCRKILYCCLAILDLGSSVIVPLNISAALSSECVCPSVCFILPSLSLADGLNLGPWPIGCLALHLLMDGFLFCPLYIAALYRFAGLMPSVFSYPFQK